MSLPVILTLILCAAFYGLLLLGAFAGKLLGTIVFGAVPLSVVLGFCFIVGTFVLTAIYALHANASEPRV